MSWIMWVLLTVALCAVNPAQTVVLHQELGPIHLHVKPKGVTLKQSLPFDQRDSIASKALGNFLQHSISKLDTDIERTVLDFTLLELSAAFRLYLYDVVVKGFNAANIHSIELCLRTGRLDFNASIPYVSTRCSAFIEGYINDITFASVGNWSIIAQNVDITGSLYLLELMQLSSKKLSYQIVDPDIKIDIKNLEVQIKILEELEAFKMTLAEFMSKPTDEIVKSVSEAVVQMINLKLTEIPTEDIRYLLEPQPTLRFRGQSPYLRTRNYLYG